MLMARHLIDRIIYAITEKPKHYIEVKNPPQTAFEKLARPQDARQIQYNKWSCAYKVYSGSYLPKDRNRLLKKGWKNETGNAIKYSKPNIPSVFYRRKSSSQWVRCDGDHWHWYNWWSNTLDHKAIKKQADLYYDKYGEPCKRNSRESHLKGKD